MNNKSKAQTLELIKGILDNTLSIAANNLVMEACVAFNSANSIPEAERDKEQELATFMRAINGQIEQAKKQCAIYVEELLDINEIKRQ